MIISCYPLPRKGSRINITAYIEVLKMMTKEVAGLFSIPFGQNNTGVVDQEYSQSWHPIMLPRCPPNLNSLDDYIWSTIKRERPISISHNAKHSNVRDLMVNRNKYPLNLVCRCFWGHVKAILFSSTDYLNFVFNYLAHHI